MVLVGAVRVVPSGKVYRQIFDDEVHLVRSLEEARNKAVQPKFPMKSGRIPVVRDIEMCAGKGLLSHCRKKWIEGMPKDGSIENPVLYREITRFLKGEESEDVIAAVLERTNSNIIEHISERRRGRHNEATARLKQELACIGREMEPFILESGKLILAKLSESDRTIGLLFKKIENDTDLEAFSVESFRELWDVISQESLYRRQWIKEMDESLIKCEVARAEKRIYGLQGDTGTPGVKRDLENTRQEQISLSRKRMELLQVLCDLLPLTHSKAEINEWYELFVALNKYIDTQNVQHMMVIRIQYERVCQECLANIQLCKVGVMRVKVAEFGDPMKDFGSSKSSNISSGLRPTILNKLLSLKVCTEKEAEKVVNPDFFRMVGKLQRQFEQELEQMFVALSNSLHSELLNHVEVMQISLQSYRSYLDEALGKLRDSNMDFLKACRLFSEGGNFSPEEVEFFCKHLGKESECIDFIEGLIMIAMEKMESNYLEQATEVINKFETKFYNLAVDRLFIEKIQWFLTNLQVKIKSEAYAADCAQKFVSALASLTENLLLELDECITIDDVQVANKSTQRSTYPVLHFFLDASIKMLLKGETESLLQYSFYN